MSLDAITWAYRTKTKPSSLKFLLVSLANYSNVDSEVWPSVDRLCELTGADRKTIINGIKELERRGYLVDTGRRKGATNQIKVYNLFNPEDGNRFVETIPKAVPLKSAENGGITVPKTDGNSTENGLSPTPPIKITVTDTEVIQKGKHKKGALITLAQWEAKQGSPLCIEMIGSWCKENDLDCDTVKKAIPAFRERMQSGENLYANFAATFKVWLRNGYLPIKFDQAKRKNVSSHGDVKIVNVGLTL